jgi:import inner membrane translocase subunit TIM17
MWGGVFSSIDCLMIYLRQKDDPYNAIVSGFLTGGILAIRGGLSVAFKNAFIGGVILMLIEGVSVVVSSIAMRHQYQMMEAMQKEEMEKMKQMMAQQKEAKLMNPWAADYNEELNSETRTKAAETMVDKAKSFSF